MRPQASRTALVSAVIAFVSVFVLVVGVGMAVMGASGYARPGGPTTTSPSTSPSQSTTATPTESYSMPALYCEPVMGSSVKSVNEKGELTTVAGTTTIPAAWTTDTRTYPRLAFTSDIAVANHADSDAWDQIILVGTLSWPDRETTSNAEAAAQRLLDCAATDTLTWSDAGAGLTVEDQSPDDPAPTIDGVKGAQARALVHIQNPQGSQASTLEVIVTVVYGRSGTFVLMSVIDPANADSVKARDEALKNITLR